MPFGINIPGLAWNSWYNPLDNLANVGKSFTQPFDNASYNPSNPKSASLGGGGFTAVKGASTTTPNPTVGTQENTTQDTTSVATGGGGGAPALDFSQIQSANDLITQANSLLGRLTNQRQTFNDNLTNTYGGYRSRLNQDFARNQGNYQTNRNQTIQDQEQAKAKIDTQVRGRANALQRLLGAAGAGDSQAALELAPYAAARSGTNLRNQVNQTYGRNLQGLDTSWNQYNTDYQNNLLELAAQQENARKKAEQDFLNQEYQARDNISRAESTLNYAKSGDAAQAKAQREQTLPQLLQILQQIDALGKQSVAPTIQDASYVAPNLAQYTTENAQGPAGVDPSVQNDISPIYQWLLQKQKEDQQNLGY